jgi:signal transduction histidine kinase
MATLLPDDYLLNQEMKTLYPLTSNLWDYINNFNQINSQDGIQGPSINAELGRSAFQISGTAFRFGDKRTTLIVMNEITKVKELEKTYLDAKQKSLLIASASHELRNPLNGLISMLELMAGHVPQEVEENLEIATHSSFFLLNVVNDILVYYLKF